jgi:hypothetical protein
MMVLNSYIIDHVQSNIFLQKYQIKNMNIIKYILKLLYIKI